MADWEILGTRLIAVNTAFLLLAFIFVGLRLWSRRVAKQSLQLNDWLILVALLCATAQGVLEDVNVALGSIALEPQQASADQDHISAMLALPSAIIWAIPLLALRLSILHYYTKTFTCRQFRKICIGAAVLVLTFFIAYVTVALLNCIPISMWWDHSAQGTCLDQSQRLFITAAVNVGVDAFVLLLAVPVLVKVELLHHQKVMGSFIMMAGVGVCAVAGLRLLFLSQGDFDSKINYRLLSLLEASTGITVASAALFYPLGRRLWDSDSADGASLNKSPSGSQRSKTPMLRRTPGSGSTLKGGSDSVRAATGTPAAAPRDEKSAVAWPLANVDPELGLMGTDREKHYEEDNDAKRTPSVEKAVHARVSGGARIVQLSPNAKRLSAEDVVGAAKTTDHRASRIAPQDLESEWGRMTARQIQAASWDRNQKKAQHSDVPQIDQWFEGFDGSSVIDEDYRA